MIVHERATHQMTIEFKLPQVPLQPSSMNWSPYQNGALKGPEIQNVKLYIKHDNRLSLMQKW